MNQCYIIFLRRFKRWQHTMLTRIILSVVKHGYLLNWRITQLPIIGFISTFIQLKSKIIGRCTPEFKIIDVFP